jgi:hypothetical protein
LQGVRFSLLEAGFDNLAMHTRPPFLSPLISKEAKIWYEGTTKAKVAAKKRD